MFRFIVVLGLKKLSNDKLIKLARFILGMMTGNLRFMVPSPSLATLLADITNMANAMASISLGPLKTATVKVFRNQLELTLSGIGAYVEGIANLDVTTASETIISAGMRNKKVRITPSTDFRLKIDGMIPGEVKMRTKSAKRATFEFQYTETPADPKSYITLYVGTKASFTATGLASGKLCSFRVRATTSKGVQPWSLVIPVTIP